MPQRSHNHHGINRKRQRGTAYVLVLAITTLLVALGLAASQLAQGQIERGETEEDVVKARLAALYAQDYLHKRRSGDTTWRDETIEGQWYIFTNLNGVTTWYACDDPIDGDLANDHTHPVLLHTRAQSGDAYRAYTAEYAIDDAGNLTLIPSSLRQRTLDE